MIQLNSFSMTFFSHAEVSRQLKCNTREEHFSKLLLRNMVLKEIFTECLSFFEHEKAKLGQNDLV